MNRCASIRLKRREWSVNGSFVMADFEIFSGRIIRIVAIKVFVGCLVESFSVVLGEKNEPIEGAIVNFTNFVGMVPIYLNGDLVEKMKVFNLACENVGIGLVPNSIFRVEECRCGNITQYNQ